MDDVFEGWDDGEFVLAFLNGRVAVVLACPEAEPVRDQLMKPIELLADRLLRYDQSYRVDRRGRGLLFGRPKLDLIVVGRHRTV